MALIIKRSWIPNLVTSGNLFCGFLAVIAAVEGASAVLRGAVLICMAACFDTLDGRAARALGVSGEFGKELDSLADVVSFGVAPALLAYQTSLKDAGWFGVAAAGVFVCCGAGRLARYNIIVSTDKRFFVGMPIPMAGLAAASLALYNGSLNPYLATVLIAAVGLLMISLIRYPSIEQVAFEAPLLFRLMFLAVFMVVLAQPGQLLWVLPTVYICYGLGANLFWMLRARMTAT